MCGILCKICYSMDSNSKDKKVLERIKNRGPDSIQECEIETNGVKVEFCGTVLWMQGPQPTIQPIKNDRGILLYNGDIFDEKWDPRRSDTDQICEKFYQVSENSVDHIVEEIQRLKGPFSIVYFNNLTNDLIFTRDRIGRNSLLMHKNDKNILISSVLDRKYECIEIPATHIFCLNLITKKLKLYQWDNYIEYQEVKLDDWMESVKLVQGLPDEEFSFDPCINWDMDKEDEPIKYIEMVSLETKDKCSIIEKLLDNSVIRETVVQIIEKLDSSVKIRLKRQPSLCKMCLSKKTICDHSSVGVLFSGGLDCTILAYLIDKYVPKAQSIDLMNVAFKKDDSSSYEVPDRITGKQSLEELKRLCPNRKWVFKEINVPKDELNTYQETAIADLVYPRQTILDESLGSALWFASKAQDLQSVSPCRILFLGSGADELFGGYTRHRNAFKRNGWTGLSKELQLDWMRISFRNLARDNRVICDHGRQPRMPYLDEDFTEFILSLKPWLKCFPSEHLGPGVGDKLFLRMAAFHLGLRDVALFPKRALQFGSRIANKKEKGSDVSKTFLKVD
ncbi:asparagine synthetase domain-containing protein CG17486 isoform X1 [Ostrinia furnacalis]|uniref:asparagine synthetase domain-containing protein CG17486 isoform X1 n=1 Tax=Ostrinia furnacalis TaxID=93504 RepID=UPI00103A20BD|nr:asparagine synthetase domain-containing protein CG17486 isoform X1 [Ostrinia furnacalis]